MPEAIIGQELQLFDKYLGSGSREQYFGKKFDARNSSQVCIEVFLAIYNILWERFQKVMQAWSGFATVEMPETFIGQALQLFYKKIGPGSREQLGHDWGDSERHRFLGRSIPDYKFSL